MHNTAVSRRGSDEPKDDRRSHVKRHERREHSVSRPVLRL